MKSITIILMTLIAGCSALATIDYQPYEGKSNSYVGEGGTKVNVDGIDFWANGTPPRNFSILGIVTSEIGSGYGDEQIIRSAVAEKAKKVGGNAAIQINDNSSFSGVVRTSPGMYLAAGVRQMKFAIVKYSAD